MKLDRRDYEAIAALEHGTLEDWAYDSARHYADIDAELIDMSCNFVVQEAIAKLIRPHLK